MLADITRILADREISIDAMVQKEPHEGEDQVDIIMLTHLTVEKHVDAALAKIEALPVVAGKVTRIRLEQLKLSSSSFQLTRLLNWKPMPETRSSCRCFFS